MLPKGVRSREVANPSLDTVVSLQFALSKTLGGNKVGILIEECRLPSVQKGYVGDGQYFVHELRIGYFRSLTAESTISALSGQGKEPASTMTGTSLLQAICWLAMLRYEGGVTIRASMAPPYGRTSAIANRSDTGTASYETPTASHRRAPDRLQGPSRPKAKGRAISSRRTFANSTRTLHVCPFRTIRIYQSRH